MKQAIPSQVLVVNENGDNIIEKEEGKEIQYTKDYGCGVDVHSLFIQVSVLVKRDLSVYEYRREFKTTWKELVSAKKWVLDTILNNSSPSVDASTSFHYCCESTSSYHESLVRCWEGKPSIINPTLAKAGRKKTDLLDALTLATADLTGIWKESFIPSIDVVELRMLVDERIRCSRKATQVSNHINNSLLRLGLTSGKNGSITKTEVLRAKVEALLGRTVNPSCESTSEETDKATNDYDESLDCPLTIPDSLIPLFKNDYDEYDTYQNYVLEYDKQILDKIKSMKWETAEDEISGEEMMKILTSAPGVGIQTAVIWLTRIVTPRRFPNQKALAAYCGCDPSLKVSAGKVTSTVKRGGRKDLHSVLCMAASNLMRRHSEPFGRFGYNIAMQTGVWKKGVSAVARKLSTALYFMTLRGETFSYEKYKMVSDPEVINVTIEELAVLNPSFKRYIRFLLGNDICDTKTLVHMYSVCKLPSIKGLGKNFFALIKDFIENQDKYISLSERLEGYVKNNNQ